MNQSTHITRPEQLQLAQETIRAEAAAVEAAAGRLDEGFAEAVELLNNARQVIVTGMGKAGLIGQKIAATLSSTGTPSHFLHPAEAFHGDLGRIHLGDVVLALSHSGETEEISRLLPLLRQRDVPLVAITRQASSTLGQFAAAVISLGQISEACPLGLAPSASTTVMLAVGDAVAFVLSRQRGFQAEDFAKLHPGGSLGRRLASVDDVMRSLESCRVAQHDLTVREVLVSQDLPGRRTGAIMLVDGARRLRGLFTDSDLARLVASCESPLDRPIAEVMTPNPKTARSGAKLSDAVEVITAHKISELPVVDANLCPLGLIDLTDLAELLPAGGAEDAPDLSELRLFREPTDKAAA